MTKLDDGGPAFPLQSIGPEFSPGYSGMTLRDWFAGQALSGTLASWGDKDKERAGKMSEASLLAEFARHSYVTADAMLAARKKGPSDE